MNALNGKTEYVFLMFYLSMTALFYFIVGVQGFDMCDEGWVLTGYQQIFNDPASVQYLFLYYLSDYVGGLWNSVFGHGGILSFRILAVLCITVTSYIVYKMLRPYVARWCIMAGTLWIFFCSDFGIMVFYHDHLTTLLSVCASFFLLQALRQDSPRLILASGIIIGVNMFVRLPNISLSLLILLLIPYYFYCRDKRKTLLMFVFALSGFVIGVTFVLLIMTFHGHYAVFVEAVKDGFSAIGEDKSTHNLGTMFLVYVGNYIEVARNVLLIFAVPAVLLMCRRKYWAEQLSHKYKFVIIVIICALYVCMLSFTTGNVYTLYSVATVVCIGVLFSKHKEKELTYISLIIIINMYALPLGSDNGISNMGFNCIWMSAPFSVSVLYNFICLRKDTRSVVLALRVCAFIFMLVVLKRGTFNIASQCYFDKGYRWEKTYLIDTPLATTYTTRKNSELLSPMLRELSKYVEEDDYLLCFQNIATVHFLTKTRPYLYNPWVWTYDPTNMEAKFYKAEKEHAYLPVVVRDKSMLPEWYNYYPDWNNDKAPESYLHKNKKIVLINRFMSKNGYKLVWENDIFQILIPPSVDEKKH